MISKSRNLLKKSVFCLKSFNPMNVSNQHLDLKSTLQHSKSQRERVCGKQNFFFFNCCYYLLLLLQDNISFHAEQQYNTKAEKKTVILL